MTTTTLVVGATGATGKYVVLLLLSRGQNVKAIVRFRELLWSLLPEKYHYDSHLTIIESNILDMSPEELSTHVQGCDAVVSCLGHTMSLQGIWGPPFRLVTDATQRLTEAAAADKPNKPRKYILMNTEGVAYPKDDQRWWLERLILWLLRCLVPPHADNEEAANYLYKNYSETNPYLEWSVIRPTNLINGDVSDYQIFPKPPGSLFGTKTVTRANVALFMVDLVLDDNLWSQHKFQMPVIHDKGHEKVE